MAKFVTEVTQRLDSDVESPRKFKTGLGSNSRPPDLQSDTSLTVQ